MFDVPRTSASAEKHVKNILTFHYHCHHTNVTEANFQHMPVIRTGIYPHMPIAVTTVVKDNFWQCIKYKIQNTFENCI